VKGGGGAGGGKVEALTKKLFYVVNRILNCRDKTKLNKNCYFFEVGSFCLGQPLLLLVPGFKKPSYATGGGK
jgi:hypothetical protein